MKDILFEKHYQAIFEIDNGADTSKDKSRFDAAVACDNTTKEMMRNFVDFADNNFTRNLSNGKWIIVSEEYKLLRDEPDYFNAGNKRFEEFKNQGNLFRDDSAAAPVSTKIQELF